MCSIDCPPPPPPAQDAVASAAAAAGEDLIVGWPSGGDGDGDGDGCSSEATTTGGGGDRRRRHLVAVAGATCPSMRTATAAKPPPASARRRSAASSQRGRSRRATAAPRLASVTFSNFTQDFRVEGKDEWTEEERAAASYTERDYRRMKKDMKSCVKRAYRTIDGTPALAPNENLNDAKYSTRGLEHLASPDVFLERRAWRDETVSAVLSEQKRAFAMKMSRSWAPGGGAASSSLPPVVVDAEADRAVAKASARASRAARTLASEHGARDAAEERVRQRQQLRLTRNDEEEEAARRFGALPAMLDALGDGGGDRDPAGRRESLTRSSASRALLPLLLPTSSSPSSPSPSPSSSSSAAAKNAHRRRRSDPGTGALFFLARRDSVQNCSKEGERGNHSAARDGAAAPATSSRSHRRVASDNVLVDERNAPAVESAAPQLRTLSGLLGMMR